MNDDTLYIRRSLDIPDRERVLDWLTALLPIFLISVIYYRWQALALEVLAVGGYLMAARLFARLSGDDLTQMHIVPALVSGLTAAFCLPATAPAWLPALFGGAVAAAEVFLVWLCRKVKWSVPRLPVHPIILAYAVIRLIIPASFAQYTMPAQFSTPDGMAAATPLTALGDRSAMVELWKLLFGVHAGAIGETCAAVILLGGLFLVLRRRVRLIAPACMLATVALLSWMIWNAPLYALLSGGLMLAALLFADRAYAPQPARDQAVIGVLAGVATVLFRCFSSGTEGVAYGILVAQVTVPFLPFIYKMCRVVWTCCVRWSGMAWSRLRPRAAQLARTLGAKAGACARELRTVARRGGKALAARMKEVFKKRKNNS